MGQEELSDRCEDDGPLRKAETSGQYSYVGRPVGDYSYRVRSLEAETVGGSRTIDSIFSICRSEDRHTSPTTVGSGRPSP